MSPARKTTDWRFLIVVLAAGLLLRLVWQIKVYGDLGAFAKVGEATRVALALAEGRGFADAYFDGSGPTAHLLPVNPALAALMFMLFGSKTAASNIALLCLALAQVGFAYVMLVRLFERLGIAQVAVRWSLIALCMVPVFARREVIDFRYWEGALALGLAAASLGMLAAQDSAASMSHGTKARAALLAAVTFFVSPVAGAAVVTCWAVFSLRTEPFRKTLASAGMVAAAFVLVVGPWAIRNQVALGATVLVRSNAGLELAIANHSAALSDRPRDIILADRIEEVHPYIGRQAREAMVAAGGEVAYSRKLGGVAQAWILAHPKDFARLTIRHVRQLYSPERWAFEYYADEPFSAEIAAIIALVNAIGLISLAIGLASGRRGYAMLAVYLGFVTLTYAILQPVPRYTYLVYGPLMFVALDGLVRAAHATRRAASHFNFGRSALALDATDRRAA